jgi:hypothetical protein
MSEVKIPLFVVEIDQCSDRVIEHGVYHFFARPVSGDSIAIFNKIFTVASVVHKFDRNGIASELAVFMK